MQQERRRSHRHRVCLFACLRTTDGRARSAVVRDASTTGAFLLTRGAVADVGDPIELELVPLEDGEPSPRWRGQVVRSRPWDTGDLWRQSLAIRFEATLPESVGLEQVAARQAAWV